MSNSVNGGRGTGTEAFGEALFESAKPGIVVVNSARQIITFTRAAECLTGLEASRVLGGSHKLLPPDVVGWVERGLTAGDVVTKVPTRIGSKTLVGSTSVARQQSGEILSVTVELGDVAAVRAIGANLEHLDRLAGLGVVTAGIAHEIKNALVAVRTFCDLLETGENDPELRTVASREIQRIERTVRDYLRGAGRAAVNMVPLHVHPLLQDGFNLLRHTFATRSIAVDARLEAVSDRVSGDERQLRHTIINLLINAAEAMPNGGRVKVITIADTGSSGQHLRIEVSDTGGGIAPEHLSRIFSPFFTTKPEGTGLGLSISRAIVEAHCGTMAVKTDFGQGTTFSILLPLLAPR